jgi:phosphatidate cytidylyltransferase
MFEKRLFYTIVLILSVISLIFFAPWPVFYGIGIILISLAQWEFYQMMDRRNFKPFLFFGIFCGIVILTVQFVSIFHPAIEYDFELIGLTGFLMVFGTFLVALARFGKIDLISSIATTLMGIFYVGWLFSFLVKIRFFPVGDGNWFLLFVLLVSKATDIAAYVIGSTLGKHKLIPAVSPKKTVEGALGGVLGAVLVGMAFYALGQKHLLPLTFYDVLFLSFLFGFFAQLGDIIESALKRDAGVKDSGGVFPGMGGMLDLVDSLLVTGPLMYFYLVQRV